jgi:hypothetical protein
MKKSSIRTMKGDLLVDERLLALQQILQSKTFSGCETIQQILRFIVEKSIADRIGEIKEYTIATEVLGRPKEFNSKDDNIVRVQVHRLRKKLDEYYKGEGARDQVQIFIPRGHYYPQYLKPQLDPLPQSLQLPQIAQLPQLPQLPQSNGQETSDIESATTAAITNSGAKPARYSMIFTWQGLAIALIVLNLSLIAYLFIRSGRESQPGASTQLARSLAPVWQPFISTGNNPPLIVFSNALFLMSEQGDLYRYYAETNHSLSMGAQVPSLAGLERRGTVPDRIGPLYYSDSYTGIGEVVGAGKIVELLARSGQDYMIKRSRITSYEDIRNHNVIFLGASLEDSILRKLPVESDLVFEEPMGNEFVGKLSIRDRHPAPGKPAIYEFHRDEKTKALQSEYALISLLPGVMPNQHILILAGLSTLGTQAAAEFAASEASMLTLEKVWANAGGGAPLPLYFQGLLEVQIRDGIAVKTNCLLVRDLHRNKQP